MAIIPITNNNLFLGGIFMANFNGSIKSYAFFDDAFYKSVEYFDDTLGKNIELFDNGVIRSLVFYLSPPFL